MTAALSRLVGVLLVSVVAVSPQASPTTATSPPAATVTQAGPADVRVLGTTREGRRLFAHRVGQRGARRSAVLISTMHGDERDTVDIVTSLRDGPRVRGIDLWLVPVYNRDGYAAHTRANSRGVDLNRNFPFRWQRQPGSGRSPGSERETRAFMRFLTRVDPDLVISFHQPLDGVDTSHRKRPAFLRRLARTLRLPLKRMDCDGGCHGTMTQWFNARHDGFAVTVELPAEPPRRYLRRGAPQGLLRALGAQR